MAGSIYSIGVGALGNAQLGVATAGHNIANAGTPGYSRQVVDLKTNQPFFSGAGFVGTGASVATIQRRYDGFLGDQLRQSNSDAADLSTYLDQMRRLSNLLGDPTAGLAPVLGGFFQAVQAVSAQPADMSSRQAMLSGAQALSARLRSFDAQLQSMREAANRSVQSSVGSINSLTQQIAMLNDRISRLTGTGTSSQQPNDLLDQREALVMALNTEIGASVVQGSDGSYNVFLSSGQAVVLGTSAYALTAGTDTEDPADVQVSMSVGAGQMRLRPEDLSGGKLGGYLSFRREGLTNAQNALGRIAMAVAASVNDQHRLGQDLGGDLGGDFFRSGAPAALSNTNNAGTATVSVTMADAALLEAGDYRLSYDGANYTLTRLADNTVPAPFPAGSLPQTVAGITLTVSGAPAAGDHFLIQPTRAGARNFDVAVSDLREIAAAAPIRTSSGLDNAGTGVVNRGTVNSPPPADANLKDSVTLTFDDPPTTYTVTGPSPGLPATAAYVPGSDIVGNGWTIQITGQPAANDQFSVSANVNGSGDNRNARLIAALQTQDLAGGASFNGAYAQLVSEVGNKTSELQVTSAAQANLVSVTQTALNGVSGVNLDEEASDLIRYQQAYQAAGKMISVANALFDTILNIRN